VKKKILILKDAKIKIAVHKDNLQIENNGSYIIVAFRHIAKIFLNKNIALSINECYRIFQKVPLFFIDHNGYILFTLRNADEN